MDGRGEKEEEVRGEGNGGGEELEDKELAHEGANRRVVANGESLKLGVVEPPPVAKKVV
jgi:hypothetical protein